jgi:hypothetical protein
MANLLLDYTVLDAVYNNGKFRFIAGDNGVSSIADPADTGLQDIDPTTDEDPVLFSYLKGTSPRALLVNITTNIPAPVPPPTSTGKYTVCVPAASGDTFTWDYLRSGSAIRAKDIPLQFNNVDVAGNPHGIVKVGDFLYIVEYDTAKIYRLDTSTFEGKAAGNACQVTPVADATSLLPSKLGLHHHGEALITLSNGGDKYVYALFTSATIDSAGYPDVYEQSTVVRYLVDSSSGNLSNSGVTRVGKNATALIPIGSGRTVSILVPAIGGKQNYGSTNGTDSNLTRISAPFGSFTASTLITGDAATALTSTGNYDIRGVAVSADGYNAYILLVTYNANYQACWRLYKTTVTVILNGGGHPISHLSGLTSVENGFGVPGYYWEIIYDNTVSGGRLWFLKGTPIRVSAGGNYNPAIKNIAYPYTDDETAIAGNVNSADLIGEMLYQAEQGAMVNTRLGTTRHLAKAVQAAKMAAKAATEEEEK